MRNKIIEFLSFLSIFFLFILIISASVRITYFNLFLDEYSMYLYINGGLGLLLYIASKIKNFKFNKYEIVVFIMIILSCLSLVNAIDINTAIFGKVVRYEGLLVWLSYYIFILNAMNIKNRKYLYIIISLIFVYMLMNLFYGLYQVGILAEPSSFIIIEPFSYAEGILGQPLYFGALGCIFYGIVLGLFIKSDMGIKKYLLLTLVLIANLGIIMSGAMSAMVALITINLVCLVEMIVLVIKKKKNSVMYLCSLMVGICSFLIIYIPYTNSRPNVKNDFQKMVQEAKSTVDTGEIHDEYGTGRIYVWRNTLEKIKEAPITGYGIDNFKNVFDGKLLEKGTNLAFDKAHNDYLQRALCEGIISSVVFIIFLLSIFFKGIFKKLSPVYYGLLLAFTAYSVQIFFSISVTRVAPVYFVIIGLLIGKISEKRVINSN